MGSQIAASPNAWPCQAVMKPQDEKIKPETIEPAVDPPMARTNSAMNIAARNSRMIREIVQAALTGRM